MPSKKHKGGSKRKAKQAQWVQQNLPGTGGGTPPTKQPPQAKPQPQPVAQDLKWTPLKTTLVAGDAYTAEHLNATALGGAVPVYTDGQGTVVTVGSIAATAGPVTISASTAATPTHLASAAPASRAFTVLARQVVTWAPASVDLVYGDALEAKHLNATALGGATPVYKNAAGEVLALGMKLPAGDHVISASCEATPTHAATTQPTQVTLKVAKAVPEITWATPASQQLSGQPPKFVLGDAQLNAQRVKGESALVYTPAKGAVLKNGTHFLRVVHPASANYRRGEATVRLMIYITADAKNGFQKLREGKGFKSGKGLGATEKKRWDDDKDGVKSKGQELMRKMQSMTLDEMIELMNQEVTAPGDRHDQGGTYPNKMWRFDNGLQVRVKPKGDAHGSAPKFCIEIVEESVRLAKRFTVQGEQHLIQAKLSIDGNPAPTGPNDTDLSGATDTANYNTGACAATHPMCRTKLMPKLAWDKPPALKVKAPLQAGVHLNARIVDEEGEGTFVYTPAAGVSAPKVGTNQLSAVLPESKRYVEGRIGVNIDIIA